MHTKYYFAILLLVCSLMAFSQAETNLPLSYQGLGRFQERGNIQNRLQGGTGLSTGVSGVNFLNPALLSTNRNTEFDALFTLSRKSQSFEDKESNFLYGNLSYLAFAFPITKKLTVSAGLLPFTNIDYNNTSISSISSTDSAGQAEVSASGFGGLNEYFLGIGRSVAQRTDSLGKIIWGLDAGLQFSYLNGNIDRESGSRLIDDQGQPEPSKVVFFTITTYESMGLKAGTSFRKRLNARNDKLFWSLGFTYQLFTANNADIFRLRERRNVNPLGAENIIYSDTLSTVEGYDLELPQIFQAGFAISKLGQWSLNLDYRFINWNTLDDFGNNYPIRNSQRVALGGYYSSNKKSPDTWLGRKLNTWAFHGGAYFEQSPYSLSGQRLNEIGINFGTGIPTSKLLTDELQLLFPRIYLGIGAGRLGFGNENLIEENFLNLKLGINFKDERYKKDPLYN